MKALLALVVAASIATPASASPISPYIFFNRCVGGCTITGGGTNDARSNQSTMPCVSPTYATGSVNCPGGSSGTWNIHEFQNQFGDTGANGHCYGKGTLACTMDAQCTGTCTGTGSTCVGGSHDGASCTTDANCADICDTADYEWSQIMACIKEVYSPFNVMVSDTRPSGGVSYTMDLVAGLPEDIGYSSMYVGGLGGSTSCGPSDNIISYSFANLNWGGGRDRILTVCGVAAQETAHAFGLEHEFEFVDGTTAATDPMSYRNDCGGQKFFRNKLAACGEFAKRDCACGGLQNSHANILAVFGPGTSTIPAPTATITFPTDGATVTNNWNNVVSATSRRGIDHIELWVNGYNWNTKAGAACDATGYPSPQTDSVVAPSGIPDGVMKVTLKAFDDLGAEGDATITLHKGAACTDASACAAGQKCNVTGTDTDVAPAGGCYWDPPAGNTGDKCTYPQFCTSGLCVGPSGSDQVCTQHCVVGVADSCPANFECDTASDGQSYCFAKSSGGGGCCSAGGGPVWPSAGLGLLVLGLVTRRRRAAR